SVNDTKPLPRIWFMVAGAVFNVVSAVIFFIIAALTGLPFVMGQSLIITDLPQTSIYNQDQVFQYDTIERVNGEYFVNIGDFFNAVASSDEHIVLTMRHTSNVEQIETATRKPYERYTITVSPDSFDFTAYVLITEIAEGSPAEEAGLQENDRIVAVN